MKEPTDEELVQLALGEKPPLEGGGSEPAEEAYKDFHRTVRHLEAVYSSEMKDGVEVSPLSEFQRERLEEARRKVSPQADRNRRRKPVWIGLAAAAMVALMAAVYVSRQSQVPNAGKGEVALNGRDVDEGIGIRGGVDPDIVPKGEATAAVLAPMGESVVATPFMFIWKSDPRLTWDVELHRAGEDKPLARASGVKSPLAVEKLFGGDVPGFWQEGGSFRWVLKAAGKEGEVASGEFRLAAGGRSLSGAGAEEVMSAVETAEQEGRHAEGLMLLFSIHDKIPVEEFVAKRRVLEEKILNR